MERFPLHYLIGFAGIWSLGNGILHDIFVLLQRKPFDRELIRLMMDGHILIFAGIFYLLCYNGILSHQTLALYISLATSVFLIGYCLLIFSMLPSWGMLLINVVVLISIVIRLFS
jgi:hypothetical protein